MRRKPERTRPLTNAEKQKNYRKRKKEEQEEQIRALQIENMSLRSSFEDAKTQWYRRNDKVRDLEAEIEKLKAILKEHRIYYR